MGKSTKARGIVMTRLRQRRKQLSLTQRQVGLRAGINQQLVTMYENGYKNPDTPNLTLLAAALECSLDYLVGLSPYPKKGTLQPTTPAPPSQELPSLDVKVVEDEPVVIVDRAPWQEQS